MDNENKMKKKSGTSNSFSESSLLLLRRNFNKYLFVLLTLLITLSMLIFLFSFEVLDVFEDILIEHGLAELNLDLRQDLHVAISLLDEECLRFKFAAQSFAMLPTVQQVIHNEGQQENFSLLESFIKFANIDSPEVLCVLSNQGIPIYSNTWDVQKVNRVIRHDLVESALSGIPVSSFQLKDYDKIEERDLKPESEITQDSNSLPKNVSMPTIKDEQGLYILTSVPVYDQGKIIGAVFAGELINKNIPLLEKIKKVLFNIEKGNAVISILIENKRIASTFIQEHGYIVDTVVNASIDMTSLVEDQIHTEKLKLLNTDFLCAFSPISNSSGQVVGILEVGRDYQKSLFSSIEVFKNLKLTVYVLLIIVGIFIFVLALFLSRLFSERIFVSLNSMTQDIALLINKITDASARVKKASAEILKSSEEQAVYFSEQAASINETTATMEELATVTKQIANYAEQVVTIAQKTTTNAQKGYQSVLDTVESMKEIKKKNETSAQEIMALGEKSQKISQVMRLINSIASQTKLIAFNASIEASAAGDIGKRFGVVATEVRRLTENVVHSTNNIKNIITEIQKSTNRLVFVSEEETKKIDDGVLLSEGSGTALQEILQIVSKTNQAAKQISLITQQQRTASDQVVTALKDISGGASESVKSSKNINTAILQLDELSTDMSNLVQKSAAFIKQENVGLEETELQSGIDK